MNRRFLYLLVVSAFVVFSGCGGGGGNNAPSPVVVDIISDPLFDGDIALDPATSLLTITQGSTESVFAGIDPISGAEFRAFLDFPLRGSGGIPSGATISTAFLDIFINDIIPQPLIGTIPIRIDLVAFQPPTLLDIDFDRTLQPSLASLTIVPPISQADFGNHVLVDVTQFMAIVQQLSLNDFQVRILLDLGAISSGLVEINDTTGPNRSTLAPLLSVTYL